MTVADISVAQPVPAEPTEKCVEPIRLEDRLLPTLIVESTATRWIWFGVAVIVCAMYGYVLARLWVPADGGVDQNAYLVGGRMIAQHFSTRLDMPNPYAFIGGMFDKSAKGDFFYPKYPFGLPLLYAMCIWIFGASKGVVAAFAVSPICAVLAVLGTYCLARLAAGSFAAVCAAILLATSQVTLLLANNPNSHASCLAFIVWGMYALVKWWQTGKMWVGILGGFLLGYAALIRYSEGLLVLPIAVACASRVRWSDWRSWLRCAAPGLAWALPILLLLIYNKCTLGDWTGYDANNESEFGSAFTWVKFQATWEEMLRTLHDMGMFFTLPLGVAGLAMLFRRSWPLALMMLAWVIPGIALYTSYYWSPDRGVAYARFFLTFFPGLFVGVAVCFNDGILGGKEAGEHPLLSIPLDVAVGVVMCIAAGVGVYRSIYGLEGGTTSAQNDLYEQQRVRQNLATTGQHLLDHVPSRSVLFAEEGGMGQSPINYIQFLRNWDLYSVGAFTTAGGRRGMRNPGNGGPPNGQAGFGGPGGFGGPNGGNGGGRRGNFGGLGGNNNNAAAADNPTPRQPRLTAYLTDLYKDKTDAVLLGVEKTVIDDALASGRRVFVAASEAEITNFETPLRARTPLRVPSTHPSTQPAKGYTFKIVSKWKDREAPPEEAQPLLPGNRRGNGGFGGPGGGGPGGNFGGRRNGGGPGRAPDISWQLVEVLRAS